MFAQIKVNLQKCLPQHFLSQLIGKVADSKLIWLKNFLIDQFIKMYRVDMQEALEKNPHQYNSFNDFFIRKLKSELRPIAKNAALISPADGTIAQIGAIKSHQLLQAKNFYFDLPTLLGDKNLANLFTDGLFTTIYLAPQNYHRVHMPIKGKLVKTIYIPGKLFSVNKMTSEIIPNLYSRNERLIAIFETELGTISLIMVGALIVGSIKMAWMNEAIRSTKMIVETFKEPLIFDQGEELGYFKLGSTVLILAEKNRFEWGLNKASSPIKMGELLANFLKKI